MEQVVDSLSTKFDHFLAGQQWKMRRQFMKDRQARLQQANPNWIYRMGTPGLEWPVDQNELDLKGYNKLKL